MTTTQNYNPLRNALVELTTPQAFRWYATQAKATATLAQTIAFRSYATAQRLLGDRNSIAIAPAIAEPEIAPAVQDDSEAVAGLENAESLCEAIAPQQEYALTEAAESEDSPVSDDWEAKAPHQEFAPAIAPELNDSESDHLAIDEPEQAKAPHQEYAQAEAIALEPDFGDAESLCEAIADDGDAAPLDDEDPTERRYWTGEEDAEALAGDEA